ncbi:MAG: alpha/beta hydrolase [Alphaproteobacteria bacterium 16-39-46]|nr:MAG: alpha/beta hydrolase [Alphaproteobacteria bacterium 16-39-46]OZA44086.1 MAG: alpha/beta hydrolase [Alphaproteobacteria bacterium 17-39-52]HQS83602.1 alpha/beta hydrolase [Alphaproteobacteria bacterium]HQS93391.1 alpha/beta hydrolase [Alphaproteobacteria bacterium]
MPEIIINGPVGRLEGRYHLAPNLDAPVALILHPHPLHGGSMNNKVTYLTYQAFAQKGFTVMRFNFRGVGRSEGVYDEGEGELGDAATLLDWLQAFRPNARSFWVSGFSFGAWIGMQLLMRRPEVRGFISIAPPANMYDFSFLAPCPVSGMIVHGNRDDIVPPDSVKLLIEKLSKQRGITISHNVIEGAGHFFKEHMLELNQQILSYLDGADLREQEPFRYLEKKGSTHSSETTDQEENLLDFDDLEEDDEDDEDDLKYAIND